MQELKQMHEEHQEEIRQLNTEQVVKVVDKNQEIGIKREELIDIRNWKEHENEKIALKKSLDE